MLRYTTPLATGDLNYHTLLRINQAGPEHFRPAPASLEQLKELKIDPNSSAWQQWENPASSTHAAQFSDLTKALNSSLRIAQIYYRNGFAAGGGGLEKTVRHHALALHNLGFKVRLIGGNPPSHESHPEKILALFEHRVIDGAHERANASLKIANEIYKGNEPDEYKEYYWKLRGNLARELQDVDIAVLHNPLFLRNMPFTQAIIDLVLEGALPKLRLIGWVHDIARSAEPDRLLRGYWKGSPWWYADRRFDSHINYVCVSPQVQDKLFKISTHDGSRAKPRRDVPIVRPGSDFISLIPSNRFIETLRDRLDWQLIDEVWICPGRIAERKNQLAAIKAAALRERTALIITGKPKVERQADGSELVKDPYFDLLEVTVNCLGLQKRVLFLYRLAGEIKDHEFESVLGSLLAFSDGVITLPLEEGFGIDARNSGIINQVVVASADPALQGNLQEAATYVPLNSHPLAAALAMKEAALSSRNLRLRQETRGELTWEKELSNALPLFGISRLKLVELPMAKSPPSSVSH